MPTSSRLGGCTFPEDPDRTCAQVLPLWSAAFDPRVLLVRASGLSGHRARIFDLQSYTSRIAQAASAEFVVLDLGAAAIRLDVIEGSVADGPVSLRFDIPDDDALDVQLEMIRTFHAGTRSQPRHERLARRLLALQAFDASEAGASLREIATTLLGPGDWPGAGDHRKSRVRRLLDSGIRMVREGPKRILAMSTASSTAGRRG
jgi:Uncharacterized conserved protein (DUF2285)